MPADSNELIVLKRVEDTSDGRKTGVWKIAHADFMTAMMAFFLIMWLVNATDDEIKKSIANYFNPMNLMASPSDARGLEDPDSTARPPASGDEAGHTTGERPLGADSPGRGGGAAGGGNVEEGDERRMDSAGIHDQTDGAAFHDPYAALASAASDLAPDEPATVDTPQTTQGATGRTAVSEAARDPFDPAYWQTTSRRPARSLRPGRDEVDETPPPGAAIDAADRRPTTAPAAASSATTSAAGPAASADAALAPAEAAAAGPPSAVAEAVLAAFSERREPPAQGAAGEAGEDPAEDTLGAAQQAVEDIRAALSDIDAKVALAAGDRSILISLTDDRAISMFPIGSAEPSASARALFARVAATLADRDGRIVVRGHTDARPFRDGSSDNWMLSFARAHATKEVLVRNGVDEARIARVEGLADREPTVPQDPLADENRRIEILYAPAGGAR